MKGQRIRSASPYEDTIGFSRAVVVDGRVLVSGTAPVLPAGACPEGAEAQARRCCALIVQALEAAGATPSDVVRTRMFLVDAGDWEVVGAVHAEVFGQARPAATVVVVAGLVDPRWLVEIEAEAVLPPPGPSR